MSPLNTAPLRVLHLEDDPSYRRFVRLSLQKAGLAAIELVQVDQLEEALRRFTVETFDAALIDLSLPDAVGPQVCHALRAHAGVVPMVVLSGCLDDELMLAAADAGFEDYLVKGRINGNAVVRALLFARNRHATSEQSAIVAPAQEPMRVLIVEDNPGDALLVEESLAEQLGVPCEVHHAGRLQEALTRLRSEQFRCVILDLSLPDSRGVGTCTAVKQVVPAVPLIIHTGSTDDALALQVIENGASDYLIKGQADASAIARTVRFATRRRWGVRVEIAQQTPHSCAANAGRLKTRASGAALDVAAKRTDAPIEHHERREQTRYPLVRTVVAIPVAADGSPDSQQQIGGVTIDLSPDGIGLELATPQLPTGTDLVVGVERRDGLYFYTGVEVRNVVLIAAGNCRVHGRLGGRGESILTPEMLAPKVDPTSLRIVRGVPDPILSAWSRLGVMTSFLMDRMQVCPKCGGLPSFRLGCRSCGSARTSATRFIHHFACAHVGPMSDFEVVGGVTCPKCRRRDLIVGADYEYQAGPARCADCHWNGTELEHIGECLRCHYRFPGQQANTLDITGYHVNRLDPLAFITAP